MESTRTQVCPECQLGFTPYNNRTNIVFCSYTCQRRSTTRRARDIRAATSDRSVVACPWCGTQFVPTSVRHTFCSAACREQAKGAKTRTQVLTDRPVRSCEICGTEFLALNGNRKKYCSPPCRQAGHSRKAAERRKLDPGAYSDYQRRYREQNNRSVRKHRLKNWYGITVEEYEALLEAQGHRCAICKQTLVRPHLDHEHGTNGVARGVLCSNCNTALGMMHDDPGRLRSAANYLERAAHFRESGTTVVEQASNAMDQLIDALTGAFLDAHVQP